MIFRSLSLLPWLVEETWLVPDCPLAWRPLRAGAPPTTASAPVTIPVTLLVLTSRVLFPALASSPLAFPPWASSPLARPPPARLLDCLLSACIFLCNFFPLVR